MKLSLPIRPIMRMCHLRCQRVGNGVLLMILHMLLPEVLQVRILL